MRLLFASMLMVAVMAACDTANSEEIQDIQRAAEIAVRRYTPAEKFEIHVVKVKGDFAKAELIPHEAMEEGNVYLKKVNGQWVGVLVSGSVEPELCVADKLPSDICP